MFAPEQCFYLKEATGVESPKKCNFLVGAKTVPTSTGIQTHRLMLRRIKPIIEFCGNSVLPIAMVPWLHQSNVYIKRKLRVWRAQKCNFLAGAKTVLTSTGLQTTPFHASPYKADNGILRKFGSTYRQGIVFAPEQCSYQKEATGMESPKMWFSSRCKNKKPGCSVWRTGWQLRFLRPGCSIWVLTSMRDWQLRLPRRERLGYRVTETQRSTACTVTAPTVWTAFHSS